MNSPFLLGILVASLGQGQELTVVELRAWVSPPEFFPRKPSGEAYRKLQARGDLYAIPGSTAHVWIRTGKPIKSAVVEILGCPIDTDDPEILLRQVPLKLTKEREAEGAFALEQFIDAKKVKYELTRYRIVVTDEQGQRNMPSLRRTIALRPEEPPSVRFLADYLAEDSLIDVSFMPVIVGARARISYGCASPHGLSKAFLLYRVLKKVPGNAPPDEVPWIRLALMEVAATKESGDFNPMTGVFFKTKFDQQVPFHAVAAPIYHEQPGRTLGGGRVFLDTKSLVDGTGRIVTLQSGDRIEYHLEVHGLAREPASAIPVGRSETRAVTLVTQEEFVRWMQKLQTEDERIRKLQQQQRKLFEPK